MLANVMLALVRPAVLLHFEKDLHSADGTPLVLAGEVAAVRLSHIDGFGCDVAIFASRLATRPVGYASPNELAAVTRLATPNEERIWAEVGVYGNA